MTREEIITGLKQGRRLIIDRRDSPALPIVEELQSQGLVTIDFEQVSEQSSHLVVRWIR